MKSVCTNLIDFRFRFESGLQMFAEVVGDNFRCDVASEVLASFVVDAGPA